MKSVNDIIFPSWTNLRFSYLFSYAELGMIISKFFFGQFENSTSRLFDDFFKDLNNIERQSVTRMRMIFMKTEKEFVSYRVLPKIKSISTFAIIHFFSHAITLPCNVKSNDIIAKFENGVLEIKLPKDESKETRKKINV
ncbi:HSP20-like chaperone [Gigaspora margarita]|uniref:HSP20-like chaperone n=1 Tax=Gigaspora margarita TaxID=4874 RepID=A0A8H4AQN2_GIGMA|nr:HSP20-like chaperone [Gigaspora margarita]